MKAGTTSLYWYLNAHPQIAMSAVKEIEFFSRPANYARGVAWYEQHFVEQAGVLRYGEASTGYAKHPLFNGVPERIHGLLPDIKLIYVLRDPVERILSHYLHERIHGTFDDPSLEQVVAESTESHIVATSRYYFQLQQYLPFFPLERILIVTSEALRDDRAATMARVLAFLDIDEPFAEDSLDVMYHQSAYKKKRTKWHQWGEQHLSTPAITRLVRPLSVVVPKRVQRRFNAFYEKISVVPVEKPELTPDQADQLRDVLRPDVESLRQLTGQSFDQWSL